MLLKSISQFINAVGAVEVVYFKGFFFNIKQEMYTLPMHLISPKVLSGGDVCPACAPDLTLVFVNKGMHTLSVHLVSLSISYTGRGYTLHVHLVSLSISYTGKGYTLRVHLVSLSISYTGRGYILCVHLVSLQFLYTEGCIPCQYT